MKEILEYLEQLAANNNRVWFNDNKSRYQDIQHKVSRIAGDLIDGISAFEPGASALTPADCLYRIYRDTRFRADKTPYKTHIGIYINPFGGKKSQLGGYYLHLEPGSCLVGGGIWCPTPPVLKALRQAIYDNVDEYLEIIRNPDFARVFTEVGDDLLKTAPKGFPKDWEHIDLIRPRSYTVLSPLDNRTVISGKLIAEGLRRFEMMKPFNDFLNYTFEENPSLPKFY